MYITITHIVESVLKGCVTMRNPNRIPYIMSLVTRGWQKVPDWRICQVFENLKRYSGRDDLFYMEDDEFIKLIIDYFDLDEDDKNDKI